MDVHRVDQIICPECLRSLAANAELCDHCGTPTRDKPTRPHPASSNSPAKPDRPASPDNAAHLATSGSPAISRTEAPASTPLLDRPAVILGLLFLVMAILGLPLLWTSRAFGRPMKIVLSIVVTLYTAALFYGVGRICIWSFHTVMEGLK